MSRIYTTKTPSLKATIADVRNLDAKKLTINGKNILDYISESEFDSYDTRDPQLKNDELDVWNTEISLSDNGHIEVKPHVHSVIGTLTKEGWFNTISWECDGLSDSQLSNLHIAHNIQNGEVFDIEGNHIMYWQSCGLTEGVYMFGGDEITMQHPAPSLTSFSSELSNLTNGEGMFSYGPLESFSSDLSSLTNGDCMFNHTNLELFSSNLSNLTNGSGMFEWCTNLTSFSSELPSLTDGWDMFHYCPKLTSFSSDLPNLTDGTEMFYFCENLTSFSSNLSSLIKGYWMFSGCKLDAPSVANIVHTLQQRDAKPTDAWVGNITVGIGCDNTEADQLLFAQECDCETWQELLDEFSAKNWDVYFECNGRPTEATTYNMRRGETLPVYTKLEEVIMPTDENKRKPRYAYTSAEGSKFYNIYYFHSTNGSTEGYDVFSSLEEAISAYNVTPKN